MVVQPIVDSINHDVCDHHSLETAVSMGIINKDGLTYIICHGTQSDGTIPDIPIHIPPKDTTANLSFQMIDDQKEKKNKQKLTGRDQ